MHKNGVKFSRINVLTRDGMRCCYCGERKRPRDLNYDHVLPRSRGGKTVWINIVTSCMPCNRRKGSKTPQEAGLKMHFKPYAPSSLTHHEPLLFLLEKAPPEWLPYLGHRAAESA